MKTIITALIMFMCFTAFAQTAGITGKIQTKDANAQGASITLMHAKDSSIVKITPALKDGSYAFENILPGSYIIKATLAAHEPSFSKTFNYSGKEPIQLSEIILEPFSKTLTGVTVTSKRPLIEQKADRTIVNVEASVTNIGATALEVLEKSPGITVDKDGNISLKGKEGVMIMVDGRPSPLSGADLANLLRSMNASQLDQVEIMTNPPARFDASGNAGVINIKTKKSKAVGYNGSASINYTQGNDPKTNEAFNFNYREGKWNLFTNLGHGYRKNGEILTIQRNLRNDSTKVVENYFDQVARQMKQGHSYNAKLGADYFLDKKTTLGISLNGFYNISDNENNNRTNFYTATKDLETVTLATLDNVVKFQNFTGNINYRKELNKPGKEITSDIDYVDFKSRNNQLMVNSLYDDAGSSLGKADSLQVSLPQDINIYSARVDFVNPLKKGAKFETGLKSTIAKTANDAGYDSILNGVLVHDFRRSNNFVYRENINAAYVNLNAPLSKKISAQLGLRLENTNAKGDQLTSNESFERNYTQLFPTAYFQFKADKKNNFGLNYGRRIRRPNYESLNPFIRFIDRYTYSQGNPNLKPQLSDNFELSHTYNNYFTTTINYSKMNDIIQQVLEQRGREAFMRQQNIASMRQLGISFSANHPVTKWWTNSLYVNVFDNKFTGIVNNEHVSVSATAITMNGTQQFKVSKKISAELSGMYRGSGVYGFAKTRPMGGVAAGASMQILKNLGTIRITARDIFLTQKMNASMRYSNVDASFQEVRDSRTVTVGFNYRFSKGKMSAVKKRAGMEEANRLGVE